MKMNKNNKKALSAGLAVAILVTGTFAWQSFSQYALNKTSGPELTEEPGGRLHDDFDGDNKDVYIENFASVEDGVDVYARIRLDEYFEYGTDADKDYAIVWDDAANSGDGGYVGTRSADLQVVRGDIKNAATPVRENVTTWDTYKFGGSAVGASDNMMFNYENADEIAAETETALTEENIRVYRDLAFGGSTSYLPTFNKDVWDKTADINGTFEGKYDEDGVEVDPGEGDGLTVPAYRYSDYTQYTMGEVIPGEAVYAEDFETNTGATKEYDEDHMVSKTESATVISMDAWKTAGSPVGAYWVYDVDGWAYYAKGISPQTASGLLLDNIQVITDPEENWFYGVNVVAQIATAGNWGDAEGETPEALGMYADGFSEDGLLVLNAASGNTAITNVSITKAGGLTLTNADLNVTAGSALSLAADVSVYDGVGSAAEKEVVWTIQGETGSTADAIAAFDATNGVFTPTTAMAGGTFKITATSKFNAAKSDSIIVTVVL